jgi:hypothetical protein
MACLIRNDPAPGDGMRLPPSLIVGNDADDVRVRKRLTETAGKLARGNARVHDAIRQARLSLAIKLTKGDAESTSAWA